VEYPGAIYHVMNRGDPGEAIFREDADRQLFLELLGQACVKTDWQVHAYGSEGLWFNSTWVHQFAQSFVFALFLPTSKSDPTHSEDPAKSKPGQLE
jgi:hypothetical protein